MSAKGEPEKLPAPSVDSAQVPTTLTGFTLVGGTYDWDEDGDVAAVLREGEAGELLCGVEEVPDGVTFPTEEDPVDAEADEVAKVLETDDGADVPGAV